MSTSAAALAHVRDLVYKRAGIVLAADKNYLIEARLLTLARELGLQSVENVVDEARAEAGDRFNGRIVEALTTNETTFFRDVHPFDALRDQVLPELLAARPVTQPLRIWSAACSTGQEAYSIAMTVLEHFPSAESRTRILGTDVAPSMVARATQGHYRQLEVNRGLPAPMLVKYFTREGADWAINARLRAMVEFKQLNLVSPANPFPPADLVFLRNVLIYFDEPTRRGVLKRVRASMAPDGYLFLGCAETTASLDDAFDRVRIGSAVCHRPRSNARGT